MKSIILLKSLFWIFFSLKGCFSCAEEPSFLANKYKLHIQGRIADSRYYGFGDAFSIALPSKSKTLEMEDFYAAPNIGGVAFFNDSGFLLKLEIDELIPEVTHLIENHTEIKDEILDALFYELLLPQLKILVPKLHLLHVQKVILDDTQAALFAVLDLPETATLVDLDTGRNLDSKRGLLLFFSKDNKELVNINMQDTLTLIPAIAAAAKANLNDRLLHHLMQYQSTFRIEILTPPKPKLEHQQSMP